MAALWVTGVHFSKILSLIQIFQVNLEESKVVGFDWSLCKSKVLNEFWFVQLPLTVF